MIMLLILSPFAIFLLGRRETRKVYGEQFFDPNLNHWVLQRSSLIADVLAKQSAFAGKIFPILSKLVIGPEKVKHILASLRAAASFGDLFFIICLGWATLPIMTFFYEKIALNKMPTHSADSKYGTKSSSIKTKDNSDNSVTNESSSSQLPVIFKNTLLFHVTDHISQAGKIAVLVYAVDCLAIIIKGMGFNVKNYSQIIAKLIYTCWAYQRIKHIKRYFVYKLFNVVGKTASSKKKKKEGNLMEQQIALCVLEARAKIVDHLLDGAVYIALAFSLFDLL